MAELRGKDFRVVLRHPRRDAPMGDVTSADRRVRVSPGQTCEGFSAEELASAVRNGYVEPVDPRTKRRGDLDGR